MVHHPGWLTETQIRHTIKWVTDDKSTAFCYSLHTSLKGKKFKFSNKQLTCNSRPVLTLFIMLGVNITLSCHCCVHDNNCPSSKPSILSNYRNNEYNAWVYIIIRLSVLQKTDNWNNEVRLKYILLTLLLSNIMRASNHILGLITSHCFRKRASTPSISLRPESAAKIKPRYIK